MKTSKSIGEYRYDKQSVRSRCVDPRVRWFAKREHLSSKKITGFCWDVKQKKHLGKDGPSNTSEELKDGCQCCQEAHCRRRMDSKKKMSDVNGSDQEMCKGTTEGNEGTLAGCSTVHRGEKRS